MNVDDEYLIGGPNDGKWFVGNSSAAFDTDKCYSMINVEVKTNNDELPRPTQIGKEIYLGKYVETSDDRRNRDNTMVVHLFENDKEVSVQNEPYSNQMSEKQVRFKITECKENNNALGRKKKTYRKRVSKKRKQNKKKKTKRRKH